MPSTTAPAAPDVTCKGITFLPVPEFGREAPAAYFKADDLPDVPREFMEEARRLFCWGDQWPAFGDDVEAKRAKHAIQAWLWLSAPSHEAKITTIAYALWVWSPAAAQARAAQAEAAPALLKALKHLVHWHDQLSPADIAMAEAAIAQAETP